MPKTTPFHSRLAPLNQTGIWKHWSGYLVAPAYQYSVTNEYYAIRNSAALLDTSPLFKYRISGSDAQKFLTRVMARDIKTCRPGRAQYTVWCNDQGFVLQDGVIMQVGEGQYWMTAAEPAIRYFRQLARKSGFHNLLIEDISTEYGILALQGPHALNILDRLTDAAAPLDYFDVTETRIGETPVIISRTGFTGDLGYEIWVPAAAGPGIWDAVMDAGSGFNITPLGTTALKMARVEAGLLLLGVDFHSARFAWVDAQRESPGELGWNWMFRKLVDDNRNFVGRAAIESELNQRTGRWTTVGLSVDWHEYERVHLEAGIMPLKHELYRETTMSIYRRGTRAWDYAGYASSLLYSPLLQQPLAIAKLPLDLATPDTEVDLEIPVIRRPVNVLARVQRMPFFDPPRKTARSGKGTQ